MIIRTARDRIGYRDRGGVLSDADADALHVREADAGGPGSAPPQRPKVLPVHPTKVIAAARATGADAIHPGYGFLSENAEPSREAVRGRRRSPSSDRRWRPSTLMGQQGRLSKIAMIEGRGALHRPGMKAPTRADVHPRSPSAQEIGAPMHGQGGRPGGGGKGMRLGPRPWPSCAENAGPRPQREAKNARSAATS